MRRILICVFLISVIFIPISLLKIEYADSFAFSNKYQIMESIAYFIFVSSLSIAKVLEHQQTIVKQESGNTLK